jgi:16S rRNA (uracil1498-N3)-methyltransferase
VQLFYQPGIPEGIHYLDPEESRHCVRVLRKKLNDTIDIVDGKGTFYKARITETNPRQTRFQVVDQQKEKPRNYRIHLAVAPTKRLERIEWLVEKATELGVDRISFVECEHSERTRLRPDRLQRKAVSAMKQSLRASLPVIEDVIPLADFFPLVDPETNMLLAHLSENAVPLSKAVEPGTACCVLIGPEGDFSENELQQASEAGFQMATLGSSRLRTETAALTALIGLRIINE